MATYFGDNTSNDYDGGDEDDFIYGYGDDDYLHGNGGADFIAGGDGADYLDGGAGDDILLGGNDNDLFYGGEGADVLSGGDGRDMALYSDSSSGGVTINLTSGKGSGANAEGDILSSIEDVMATIYDDILIGSNVANAFYAGNGHDYIEGLGGNDTIYAGDGNDQVSGGTGGDTLDGGDGIDTLSYYNSASGVTINLKTNTAVLGEAQGDIISGFENIIGSNWNDTLTGSNVDNVISGYGGNDLISGGAGADTISGGAGVDHVLYWASPTGVAIDLEAEAGFGGDAAGDTLSSIENVDGTNWADALLGDAKANVFWSGNGMDVLNGRGGADEMHGGADNDTYYVDSSSDSVFEAAGEGADKVFTSVSYTLAAGQEIETLATTNAAGVGAIDLTGNGFANLIQGNAGINILNGGGGVDTMVGFGGNDKYYVDNAGDIVTEAAGGGSDRVFASVNYTLGAAAEVELFTTTAAAGVGAINLTGNGFANIIQGNAGINVLNGGGGVDTMSGFGGNDMYYVDNAGDSAIEAAGGGSDRVFTSVNHTLTAGSEVELFTTTNTAGNAAINLTGNALAQTIQGNAGANTLNGKAGNDALTGFGGSDVFVFNTALNAATNLDTVSDFSHADDTFNLDNAIFAQLGANGALNPQFFKAGAAATDANDHIVYNQATGALFYDSNGNGAGGAVHFATLVTKPALFADDFVVI